MKHLHSDFESARKKKLRWIQLIKSTQEGDL